MIRTSAGKLKHVAKKSLSQCPKCSKYYEGDTCPHCDTVEMKHEPRKLSK